MRSSAATPTAVLKLPVTVPNSEYAPNALFATPVVTNGRALCPSLVFNTPDAVGLALVCLEREPLAFLAKTPGS